MPESNIVSKAIFFSMLLSPFAVAAEDAKKTIDDPAYTHAQRLVEVEPGRRLNLYCLGKGTPTVIFEAGMGGDNSAWALVQPAIAAHTRACSYDRAGIGFSDPARRPSDSANIVDDLHHLLNAASINPTYILVGHSMGGMYVRLYADTHFNDIAGMVLVDSAEETWRENWWRLDPKQPSHEQAFTLDPKDLEQQRECIEAAKVGFAKDSEIYKHCVPSGDPLYSEAINAVTTRNKMTVAYQQASSSEANSYQYRSSDEVIAARRWYDDMPLIVLTSTPREPQKDESQAHRDALNRVHAVFADQLAALSKRGVVRPVPHSTHNIQNTQPEAVISAILEVLKDAQESKAHVPPADRS